MRDKNSYKTSKKDFELFRSETLKWLKRFGLNDWFIEIEHETPERNDARAICLGCLEDKHAFIKMDVEWDIKPTSKSIKEAAFHEAAELLLMRFTILAGERFVSERELVEARHSVIQVLYNLVGHL